MPRIHLYTYRLTVTILAIIIAIGAIHAIGSRTTSQNSAKSSATSIPVKKDSSSSSAKKDSSSTQSQSNTQTETNSAYATGLSPLVTRIATNIDKIEVNRNISSVGFTPSDSSLDAIRAQITSFENSGFEISFVVSDISTGATLAYRPNSVHYSASAIKGPVVLSDFAAGSINAANPGTTTTNLIQQTIVNSNNDTYAQITQQYGLTNLSNWADSVNVDNEIGRTKYAWMSAADFAKLWALGYDYLFATGTNQANSNSTLLANAALNDTNKQWFANYFTQSHNSFINQALTSTVYTKPGWINTDQYFLAQNDAGIVKSDKGDYIIAVMSTAYGQYDQLSTLVQALAAVHNSEMVMK